MPDSAVIELSRVLPPALADLGRDAVGTVTATWHHTGADGPAVDGALAVIVA